MTWNLCVICLSLDSHHVLQLHLVFLLSSQLSVSCFSFVTYMTQLFHPPPPFPFSIDITKYLSIFPLSCIFPSVSLPAFLHHLPQYFSFHLSRPFSSLSIYFNISLIPIKFLVYHASYIFYLCFTLSLLHHSSQTSSVSSSLPRPFKL